MDKEPSAQSLSTLKRVIHDAFDGVRLGNGVGLWEGQAIDDYTTGALRQQARDRDEKAIWSTITADDLNRCASSLSFTDAEGMRFLLPAYMLLEVNGLDETGSLIFHLTKNCGDTFSALDQAQRDAVYDFLRWCSHQPIYEYERDDMLKAMDQFWSLKT
ncbi:MAG: DUF6714 family protein [Phycisphaeraceae bacterium]